MQSERFYSNTESEKNKTSYFFFQKLSSITLSFVQCCSHKH